MVLAYGISVNFFFKCLSAIWWKFVPKYTSIVPENNVSNEGRACPTKHFVMIANFEYGLCSNSNRLRMMRQLRFFW